ncbi:MAG: LysR family transcriptional regulator [Clostridia bacterium]|nr:LysR family transcriptional regulator [Clostridia bacterium]
MDSRQLLYFKAVCDEGGFTKAAEKLFISPQGISKAIHKLEDELGVPLFETTPLGVR